MLNGMIYCVDVSKYTFTLLKTPETSWLTILHFFRIESVPPGVGRPPLCADHDVVTWLVPEVVAHLYVGLLPVLLQAEVLAIQQNKPACSQ